MKKPDPGPVNVLLSYARYCVCNKQRAITCVMELAMHQAEGGT